MSEQIDYQTPVGQPSPGGKYTEMVPANPLPKEDFGDETFSSDNIGIREAADQVATRREETKEERQAKAPIERPYQQQGGTGERSPTNQRVGVEQAAHDLTQIRQQEQAQEIAAVEELLRNQIDGERGVQTTEALQAPNEAFGQQALSEVPAFTPGNPESAELIRALESNPVLLSQFATFVQAKDGEVAQAQTQAAQVAQAAQQYFAAELSANANASAASLFTQFGELRGLGPQEINGALAALDQTNPQRALAIRQHINATRELVSKAEMVQQQQAQWQHQQHQQAFQHVATLADTAYDKWITEQEPDAGRRQEISTTAHQMLRDSGLSEQELTYHWQTSPILRSFTGQQILADAARYRMSVSGARSKAVRAVPTVQRPGSPLSHEPQERYDMRLLESRLNQSGSAKDAAALLTARRGARR